MMGDNRDNSADSRREVGGFGFVPAQNLVGKAEFIFIDGGHDAPVVTSDTLKALEMVSPDGVIVWHDYRDFKGVQEAIAVAVQRKGDANFRFIRDTSMVAYQPAGFG